VDFITLPFQSSSQFGDMDADAAHLDGMEGFPG